MTIIISDKVRVGISACNIGAKLRWNRAGWDRLDVLQRERNAFIWVPVCPEINAGFGTPRNPVKLVNGNGDDIWSGKAKVKSRQGEDVTQSLKQGAKEALEVVKRSQIEAFIYMDGSPSCGVYRTTLRKKSRGHPPGVFGSLLLKEELFLIPVLDLDSPVKWWDWRRRLHAFVWLKRKNITSKRDLVDVWHILKFMCQEVNRNEADLISHSIANMPLLANKKFFQKLKRQILDLIRQPSSMAKIKSYLQKHIAFYCKKVGKDKCDITSQDIKRGSHRLFEQLLDMEKRAIKEDIEFAGTPIIFRDRQR